MTLMKGDTTTMAEDAAKEHSMQIEGLDHLVLTVGDVDRTRDFYERVLGMEALLFGEGRHALAFGQQKINLHEAGREFEPKAGGAYPGLGRPLLPHEHADGGGRRTPRGKRR